MDAIRDAAAANLNQAITATIDRANINGFESGVRRSIRVVLEMNSPGASLEHQLLLSLIGAKLKELLP